MCIFDKASEWQKTYTPMAACNVTKVGIYEFAENLAEMIHFKPGDNITDVVQRNGGEINFINPFSFRDEDGTIFVHKQGSFNIFLPDCTGPLRDCFTIAHELGHYILHTPHEKSWAARRGSSRIEWEANWFASGFLMPKSKFQEAIIELGKNAPALAARFNVSISAAETRLAEEIISMAERIKENKESRCEKVECGLMSASNILSEISLCQSSIWYEYLSRMVDRVNRGEPLILH